MLSNEQRANANEQLVLAHRDFGDAVEALRKGQNEPLDERAANEFDNHVTCFMARLQAVRDMVVKAVVIALALIPSAAEACHRCGRSPCRFVQQVVASPVVQQVVAPPVYVIQNNVPAPLVSGGSTAYTSTGPQGYQAATIPLLDPQSILSQSLQLVKAGNDANVLAAERITKLMERQLELQAPTAERLAAGQAASMVLQAAGLDPSNKPAALQSSAVVIRRDAAGAVQVQPLTQTQIEQLTVTTTQSVAAPQPAVAPVVAAKFPMLTQFCAKCHGTDLATPKGGFFLGDDDNVAKSMRDNWFSITRQVSKGLMPPAGSPQPTQAEKAALLNEIESIIEARGGAK